MKLYTDKGNIRSLKIFTALNVSGCDAKVTIVKPEAKVVPYLSHSQLPVFELEESVFLFSSNSVVSYLLSNSSDSGDFISDSWIEWEAVHLQPIVYQFLVDKICHNTPSPSSLSLLVPLLAKIDKALVGKDSLVGKTVDAADIIIWATVYPLFCDKGLLSGEVQTFMNITRFVRTLSLKEPFKKAIVSVFETSIPLSLKASLSTQPKLRTRMEDTQEKLTIFGEKPSFDVDKEAAVDGWLYGRDKCDLPQVIVHPITPKPGARNILITSALPYVNNVPHLGNLIGAVLSADVFSRYCKLRNYNALYICGSDEYGTATETKAVEENMTPRQICDKYHEIHSSIYSWFNIAFDTYGRTSTEKQTEIAQDIFWRLYNSGYVIKDSVDQLYCDRCTRYLADRFVEGTCPLCQYEDARGDQCDKCGKLINAIELVDPRCKICSASPKIKTSQHLFLDLPKLEPELSTWLKTVFNKGNWSTNAKTITNSWIRDGLKPRCISRDLKWGTPVPLEGYTDKVFYVWFDAPIGYLSIVANYTDEWEKWWKNPQQVELYNFLGKDNVPFHSVIFPCTLIGANDNYTLVNHIMATEYLNYEAGKFSKSRGVGVFGSDAQTTGIPPDVFRFYLLSARPESQDSVFTWDEFMMKNNTELLNNLGNFINRGLTFLKKNFDGIVQRVILDDVSKELLALVNEQLHLYVENLEKAKLRDGLWNILSISRYGNQYLQHKAPWVLMKGSQEEKKFAGSVVSLTANISCLLSVLIAPYMPDTSTAIQSQLNAPHECNVISNTFVCYLPEGHKVGTVQPLFNKIEAEQVSALKEKFGGANKTQ